MSGFNQKKYIQEYKKEKYGRIILDIPKEDKDEIKQYCKANGYGSMTQYIIAVVKEDMEKNQNGGSVSE